VFDLRHMCDLAGLEFAMLPKYEKNVHSPLGIAVLFKTVVVVGVKNLHKEVNCDDRMLEACRRGL
jgi:hypothetical protein